MMKVFIAGGVGRNFEKKYLEGIEEIGKFIASSVGGIVCTASPNGPIGEMYRAVWENGGTVDHITPHVYLKEAEGLDHTSLEVCNHLYDLQMSVAKQTRATVVLPGGNGTLGELFMFTDNIKSKFDTDPVFIYNCNGFYEPIKRYIEFLLKTGAMKEYQKEFFQFCETPQEVINKLCAWNEIIKTQK